MAEQFPGLDYEAEFREIMIGMASQSRDLNAIAQLHLLNFTNIYPREHWAKLDLDDIKLETARYYALDREGVEAAYDLCIEDVFRTHNAVK